MDLSSGAVTSRLSEVSVTHDDTTRLRWFKLFIYRRSTKVVNTATQAIMAYHTIMARGEAQSKLSILVNLSEAQPKHVISLSTPQQLKHFVLSCPKVCILR